MTAAVVRKAAEAAGQRRRWRRWRRGRWQRGSSSGGGSRVVAGSGNGNGGICGADDCGGGSSSSAAVVAAAGAAAAGLGGCTSATHMRHVQHVHGWAGVGSKERKRTRRYVRPSEDGPEGWPKEESNLHRSRPFGRGTATVRAIVIILCSSAKQCIYSRATVNPHHKQSHGCDHGS